MDPGKLEQLADGEWRINPMGAMRVPGIIYADADLIAGMDESSIFAARRRAGRREYALLAFGGAGGQHACAVADALGSDETARARALLRAQGVPYQELDVGRSAGAAARFRRLRARGVPVLLIGNRRIDGFQPDAIRQALRQAGLAP